MALRILCLGAGATGGYYGARLLQTGSAKVSFLVRTSKQANHLRQHGLKVLSPSYGDFIVKNFPCFASIKEDNSAQDSYDVIILSCKSYDLENACDALSPFVKKHSQAVILPVLNGLAHFDYLDKRFGPGRVVGGVAHVSSTIEQFGVISQITAVHRITFGSRPNNKTDHTNRILQELRDAFAKTIVEVRFVDNIELELWEKFVLLATLAASTCMARATIGDIMETEEGERIIRAILAECVAAATKEGYPPRLQLHSDVFGRLTERKSLLAASMLRDMESEGRTEARHIVRDMLVRCRGSGNPGTYLSAAWMVLQARDQRRARESKL